MMARALRLAERGAYTTRPNPMVGCVIAQGEEVVGEGWHQRAGEPHAEVLALQAAGERAQGATAYVTLEPCAHTGRTGPCARGAGRRRRGARGRGDARSVPAGRRRRASTACARPASTVESRPDGSAGARSSTAASCRASSAAGPGCGSSWRPAWTAAARWPTASPNGSAARPRAPDVQRWRARAGAILTGAGTVLADDPALTVRLGRRAPRLRAAAARGARSGPGDGRARPRARRRCAHAVHPCARRQAAARHRAPRRAAVAGARRTLRPARGAARCWPSAAINEVQVEAGATLAGAFLARAWSTRCCCTSRRCCWANAARPLFDGLGIDSDGAAPAADRSWRRAASARTCGCCCAAPTMAGPTQQDCTAHGSVTQA